MKGLPDQLRLYGVLTPHCVHPRYSLEEAVEAAIVGGMGCLQLRLKGPDGRALYLGDTPAARALLEQAERIRGRCRECGVLCLVDDDPTLALRLDADGLHLGPADLPLAAARKRLGEEKIYGATARQPEQARAAEAAGAAYIGSGAIFGSRSKRDAQPMTRETLRAIRRSCRLPLLAIGGIDAVNIRQLRGLGLAGVAVLAGLFGQPDIRRAAALLREQAERL